MNTTVRIKEYRSILIPSQNRWGLGLSLEAASPAEPNPASDIISFSSVVELAAALDILRHAREATYNLEDGAIIIPSVALGR